MTPADLVAAGDRFGTPAYVYDLDEIAARAQRLRALFDGRFGLSYAIKANPNRAVLAALKPYLSTFDASSLAEVDRALDAGMDAARITFSGPAKRDWEITGAIDRRIGELVIESPAEAAIASAHARRQGLIQACLVRINPVSVPRGFGASMSGTPSQFGIDEEDMDLELPAIRDLPGLDLIGFHIYSGSNCLDAAAIAENFAIFADIFVRAAALTGIAPRRLVFGAGMGVPYLPDEAPLDHEALPDLVRPVLDGLLSRAAFADARCNLELGRWLTGPCGWLVSRVITRKDSRGARIVAVDAGFNNHLAACGMMGSVFRRNWVIDNVSAPDRAVMTQTLVGPLCTSIDRLAHHLDIPELAVGDLIAVAGSGAYGPTASPTRFISHPEPREIVREAGIWRDASEPAQGVPPHDRQGQDISGQGGAPAPRLATIAGDR